MIEFPDCKSCVECPLHQEVKNPGIPTRIFEVNGHSRALIIIGMAPGYHEDQAGKSWVGWSGNILAKFINAVKFPSLVDVYLSNALRCRVAYKQKPTKTQINSCRPNLLFDIQRLLDNYKEVIILSCGADAARAVAGISRLNDGLKLQGLTSGTPPLQILSRMPVLFFTNHPAILYAGRKPEKVNTIQAHFMLLRRYLTGNFIPNKLQVVPELGAEVPPEIPPLVTCDIETYGILKGYNQTVFTPAKSKHIDGIPYGKQVITVAFGYRDIHSHSPCRIRTPVYIFADPNHRKLIRKWIKGVIEAKSVLQGQNFKYDLLYLIMNDPVLEKLLDPNLLKVDDTLIKTFLLDESQSEKGLKELSLLYGIANYQGLVVTGSKGNAESGRDPGLLYYNSLDSAATLVLGEEIDERIKIRYGSNSAKLGDVCTKMRNTIIWDVVGMERAGGCIDTSKLKKVNEEYMETCSAAMEAASEHGVTLAGKGSRSSLLDFMSVAIRECNLLGDKRVERTKVKKEISVNKPNINLVLQYLPEGELRDTAQQLQVHNKYSHLINTYTNKLLTKPQEGIVHRKFNVGRFYPVWYPVPSVFEKGGVGQKEKKGGTIQGRVTARKPPAQTFPPPVLGCLKSRFPAGTLRNYDLNRIELVIPAFLSGDPPMLKSLQEGNPHIETALLLFPDDDPLTIKEEQPDHYQLGKGLNFLVQYRGGAGAYQMMAREFNIAIEYDFCKWAIEVWWKKHPILRKWQDEQVEVVVRQGYLELPTGWSRTFGAGKANAMKAINEICNFPIQTLAAQLLLSGQFIVLQGLNRAKARSVISSQSYDSITVDVPYNEVEIIDEIVGKALTFPPLRGILEEKYGRNLPLAYERTVH